MSEELRFEGQVAIVTGAARGLGREEAVLLGARGAKVVANARSVGLLQSVVDGINGAGGEAVAVPGDLSDPATAVRVVDVALKRFGRLDVLVNNAGGAARVAAAPFGEISSEGRDSMMRQNFDTAWDMTAAAWPHMVSQGYGRIVMVSSPVALWGLQNYAHYAAAKAALLGLTKALAVEGGEHGVKVNALAPSGYTEVTEETVDDEHVRAWLQQNTPASAIATGVAWLSHENCTATGEIFEVSGAWIARVLVGEGPGFLTDLDVFTPEAIDANVSQVFATDGLLAHANVGAMGGAMMARLASRG